MLLVTSVELRWDQFAWLLQIHSEVDLYPDSHSFLVLQDECELKADKSGSVTIKITNPGNWHTACHTYSGRFLWHDLKLTTYRESWRGDFVLQCQTPGWLLSGGGGFYHGRLTSGGWYPFPHRTCRLGHVRLYYGVWNAEWLTWVRGETRGKP